MPDGDVPRQEVLVVEGLRHRLEDLEQDRDQRTKKIEDAVVEAPPLHRHLAKFLGGRGDEEEDAVVEALHLHRHLAKFLVVPFSLNIFIVISISRRQELSFLVAFVLKNTFQRGRMYLIQLVTSPEMVMFHFHLYLCITVCEFYVLPVFIIVHVNVQE